MPPPLLSTTTALLALSLHAVCGALAASIPAHAERAVMLSRHGQVREEYDYVVVGGGTSGLVVANRLTENPESAC